MTPGTASRIPAALHPFWITFLACLPILILRDPGSFLAPPVMLEDAVEMLSYYYRAPAPEEIFRFYNGYTSVGPNIIGYIAGQAPLWISSYILHWVPIAMAAATFSAIQIRGVDLFGLDRTAKFLIALLLCLLPMANWALVSNTTYMLWNALIFSTVLILLWTPGRGWGTTALMGMLLVFSWTHPLFIVLAPALAVRVFTAAEIRHRIWFAAILVSVLAYMVLGLDIAARPEEVENGGPVRIVLDSALLFFSRGIFEPVFSSRLRSLMADHGLFAATVAIGAALMAAALAVAARHRIWTDRAALRTTVLLLLFAGLYTAASVASGKALLLSGWGQRYTYPAGYLVMLLAGAGTLALLRERTARHRILAISGVALYLLALNIVDLGYYRTAPAESRAVQGFLRQVEDLAAQDAPYCGRLERGRWSITLSEDWSADRDCPVLPAGG
ncbi:MAG: hypothetical protein KDA50_00700 [Rhodobacteraceae bacterium]|nr:hypothetical protein [Paracoccaceae bacterium]